MDTNLILNLGTKSCYSLLNSTLTIDSIIKFASSNNQKYVALCDDNLYCAYSFYKKAKANNLKPVIGINLEYDNIHLALFAKNYNGFLNLIKINSFALTNSIKAITLDDYLSDLLIIDINGSFNSAKYKTYKTSEIAFNFANCIDAINSQVVNFLRRIENNDPIEKLEDLKTQNALYLLDQNTFNNSFNVDQINTLNEVIKQIDLEIVISKDNLIDFAIPNQFPNKKAYLKHLCQTSLESKIANQEIDTKLKETYVSRFNYELDVIDKMGFNNYFLVVADFVNYARNNNILIGPGRGSAAGSLIAYLLNITQVDSIKYNLVFERFLNEGRVSLPDIDLDVEHEKRDLLINYIVDKYGKDHVCQIATFIFIKAKLAIRDVSRILKKVLIKQLEIDEKQYDKEIGLITSQIPIEYEDDLEKVFNQAKNNELFEKYSLVFQYAQKILNLPRQIGIHAAGIILSKKKLVDITPIQYAADNQTIISQYDMKDLEENGLLKIDILGLTNLSIISQTIDLIKKTTNESIDLLRIDLTDQKVYENLSKGNTVGIFQLESRGMTGLIKKLKPVNIEDISLCISLYRPGPMQQIDSFINKRNQIEKVEYIDERNKDIFASTYGVLIYQEQVIKLVQRIGNFSLSQSDDFRRMIAKKDVDYLDQFKKAFFENGLKNNYTKKHLEQIYQYIYTFANYGFNHSHACSYAIISYWMAYLKTYYTKQFLCIILSNFSANQLKSLDFLKEAKKLEVSIYSPDINLAHEDYSLQKDGIMIGFKKIDGISIATASKIIDTRNQSNNKRFNSLAEAILNLLIAGVGKAILLKLVYTGCFDSFDINKSALEKTIEDANFNKQVTKNKKHFLAEQVLENVFSKLANSSEQYLTIIKSFKALYEQALKDVSCLVNKEINDLNTANNSMQKTFELEEEYKNKKAKLLGIDLALINNEFNKKQDKSTKQASFNPYKKYFDISFDELTTSALNSVETIVLKISSNLEFKTTKTNNPMVVGLFSDNFGNKQKIYCFEKKVIKQLETYKDKKDIYLLSKLKKSNWGFNLIEFEPIIEQEA